MPKILIISPEISGGGIGTYYRNLIPKLKEKGFEVTLAGPDSLLSHIHFSLPLKIVTYDPITYAHFLAVFDHLKIFPLLRANLAKSWALFEKLKKETFDLIEIAEYPLSFLPWLLNPGQPPILIKFHGSLGQIEQFESRHGNEIQTTLIRYIEDLSFHFAEGLGAYSTNNKEYWSSRLNKAVSYFPPFFPTLPSKVFLPRKNEFALVMGRVQTWKGPEELCQAAALLGDQFPFTKWIGGDNYYRNYSVKMSGYLKSKYPVWGSRIIHTGRIPYDEAQQKLASAKFLIVPSLWDTFNFTVVEGMAKGKVVICSDGAGASEHIIDGVNGFVYPARDVAALAEKIRITNQLSSEEYARIGTNARETVERVFASEEPVKQRIQLYEELIIKGPSPKDDPELEWLRDWLSPNGKSSQHFPDVLLDQLSLKWLGKYMVNRVKKKFF